MEQVKAVDNIATSFIESWNENNPTERLAPELIELVRYHLHLSFVAGFDEITEYLLRDIRRTKVGAKQHERTLSIDYINETIRNFKP